MTVRIVLRLIDGDAAYRHPLHLAPIADYRNAADDHKRNNRKTTTVITL